MNELEKIANELASKVSQKIKDLMFDDAANIALAAMPQLNTLVNTIVPAQAFLELDAKLQYFGEFDEIDDIPMTLREQLIVDKYLLEQKLLETHDDTVAANRWTQAKPKLEARYGRSFESRADIAVMNMIHFHTRQLEWNLDELRHRKNHMKSITNLANTLSNSDEIQLLWNQHWYAPLIADCTQEIISLFTTINEKDDLFGKYADFNSVHHMREGQQVRCPTQFAIEDLWKLTRTLIQLHEKSLTFTTAINMCCPQYAKLAGLEEKMPDLNNCASPVLISQIQATIKQRYEERSADAVTFAKYLADAALARWKITAQDYSYTFFLHQMTREDAELVKIFYFIRDGKACEKEDERITKGRLPQLIQTCLDDKIITADQIIPALPSQTLMRPIHERIATLPSFVTSPIIDTTKRLPSSQTNSLVKSDVQGHKIIYHGKSVFFLTSLRSYPSGDPRLGEIFAAYPTNKPIPHDQNITIAGEEYLLRKIRAENVAGDAHKYLQNIDRDVTAFKACTGIVRLPFEEFARDHFQDFMAHALAFSSQLDADLCFSGLRNIAKFKPDSAEIYVGERGRVTFKTRKLEDLFEFSIDGEYPSVYAEVFAITAGLLKYLADIGVPVTFEPIIDEFCRKSAETKLQRRNFRDQHLEEVVAALQGDGLAKFIVNLNQDRRYHRKSLDWMDKPCDHCGAHYVYGNFYRPDLREQWTDGVHGEDLHILHTHPKLYVPKWDNLEKIYRALNDVEKSPPIPILSDEFVKQNDAVALFVEFQAVLAEYRTAEQEYTDFYMNTSGGIREDDEEIAASPELQRLRAKEIALVQQSSKTEDAAKIAASKLTKKLSQMTGQTYQFRDEQELHFWAHQQNILEDIAVAGPQLLGPYKINLLK